MTTFEGIRRSAGFETKWKSLDLDGLDMFRDEMKFCFVKPIDINVCVCVCARWLRNWYLFDVSKKVLINFLFINALLFDLNNLYFIDIDIALQKSAPWISCTCSLWVYKITIGPHNIIFLLSKCLSLRSDSC